MLRRLKKVLKEIALVFRGFWRGVLESSVSILEVEYLELEYAFLTALFGPLIGVRTVPLLTSLELIECAGDEVRILLSRGFRGEDVLADLVSVLGGG